MKIEVVNRDTVVFIPENHNELIVADYIIDRFLYPEKYNSPFAIQKPEFREKTI